jgi:hypothetical protein
VGVALPDKGYEQLHTLDDAVPGWWHSTLARHIPVATVWVMKHDSTGWSTPRDWGCGGGSQLWLNPPHPGQAATWYHTPTWVAAPRGAERRSRSGGRPGAAPLRVLLSRGTAEFSALACPFSVLRK